MISSWGPPRSISFFVGEIGEFGVNGVSGVSGKSAEGKKRPLRLNGSVSMLGGLEGRWASLCIACGDPRDDSLVIGLSGVMSPPRVLGELRGSGFFDVGTESMWVLDRGRLRFGRCCMPIGWN